jgi:hypothetical protein
MANTQIKDLLKRSDPLLSFKWVCPEDLPFGLPGNFVEGVDLPWRNIRIGEGVYQGSKYDFFPGPHDISSFQMTFYEDDKASCVKWIDGWKNEVKNFETGLYRLPSHYKKDIKVQLLDSQNNPIMTVTLIRCWPAETGNWSLNYTDNGRLTVSQTFSVDDQKIEFHR